MKKILALILIFIMVLSLAACGAKEEMTPCRCENNAAGTDAMEKTDAVEGADVTEETDAADKTNAAEETNTTEATELTEEQQLIIDAVNAKLATEEVANWLSLCKDFTGEEAPAPKATNVTHYQIPDFDEVEMDCYLVTVSSKFAHWVNEEAQEGIVDEKLFLFIDNNTKNVVDSITTNAINVQHDTKTEEGRATYLLWIYNNVSDGSYNGFYLNDKETVTELTEADLKVINDNLN